MSFLEIQTGKSINAVDAGGKPEPADTSELDGFDTPAAGPNRVTIWVPEQHTALNLGAPVFSGSYDSKTAKKGTEHAGAATVDGGFVAQTDKHVHFQTWGVDTSEGSKPSEPIAARTVVRLGTPVTVVPAVAGQYGNASVVPVAGKGGGAAPAKTTVGATLDAPYNVWDGYALVTEGAAYQESYQNHIIASGNADVRIGAKRAVVLGSPGDVHISAGGASDVGSFIQNSNDPEDPSDLVVWVQQSEAWNRRQAIVDSIAGGLAVWNGFYNIYWMEHARPATVGETGWKGYMQGTLAEKFMDLAGTAGSLLGPFFAVTKVFDDWSNIAPDAGPSQNVTVFAENNVAIVAESDATISASSISHTAVTSASMSSMLTTSISSLGASSVSGTAASVTGLLGASLSSLYGAASVTGLSTAQIASWGNTFVAAQKDVQVNSMTGNVYVHGAKSFYVGCGAGEGTPIKTLVLTTGESYAAAYGFGIAANEERVSMGLMQEANKFANPKPHEKLLMTFSWTANTGYDSTYVPPVEAPVGYDSTYVPPVDDKRVASGKILIQQGDAMIQLADSAIDLATSKEASIRANRVLLG